MLEIVLSLGLVKFIDFITALCGGQEAIVNYCIDKKILLPIGSPPIICLIPCRKPAVTLSRLAAVSFIPGLLFCFKVSILAIDITLFLIGHQSSGDFFACDNLHNIVSFPVGLCAIYCYNMIIFITTECLPGNTQRFLGIIVLIQFILFDCLRLFFIFLTGKILISLMLLNCKLIHNSRNRNADLCSSLSQSRSCHPHPQEHHQSLPGNIHWAAISQNSLREN